MWKVCSHAESKGTRKGCMSPWRVAASDDVPVHELEPARLEPDRLTNKVYGVSSNCIAHDQSWNVLVGRGGGSFFFLLLFLFSACSFLFEQRPLIEANRPDVDSAQLTEH